MNVLFPNFGAEESARVGGHMGLLDRLFGRKKNLTGERADQFSGPKTSSPYGTALQTLGLRPGDRVRLTCPKCSAPFVMDLPPNDSLRIPWVSENKVSVTCANHCFADSSLADFQPLTVDAPPADWIENKHCTPYWTDTPASRCPVCGVENYRQTLNRVVGHIRGLPDGADQEQLIDLTKDLVATFDGVMRAMARGHAANLSYALINTEGAAQTGPVVSAGLSDAIARWPATISFQNLVGARKNLLEASCTCTPQHRGEHVNACPTGSDIEKWVTNQLSADAWRDAGRVFQKRHLYQHGLGAADAKYIAQTGDHAYRVGQIVSIRRDELEASASTCSIIANRFFGLYLS